MKYDFNRVDINQDRLEQEIRRSTIAVAFDYSSIAGGVLSLFFKATLSSDELATLQLLVNNHVPTPLPNTPVVQEFKLSTSDKTPSGYLKVAGYEAEGESATIVSHDFSRPTSWFQFSLPMEKEILQLEQGTTYTSPLNTTANPARINWIDLFHGLVYDEDNVVIQNPGKYDVKIYVDDVLQPATSYVINYPTGRVIFDAPVTGVVTASYYYAHKSYYSIKPRPGKVLSIKQAEVQFSAGTILQSSFVFEVWATINHPIYGVMTVQVPNTAIYYKNAKDFISACNQGQGLIPAWGELTKDVHVFPFHYARPKPLKASQNVEIRVYCKDHKPLSSEFANVTFYVTIDNEVI